LVSIPNPGVAPSAEPPSGDDQVIKPIINVTRERLERPLRAPDVELVGRVQDSAFKEEQWLICFEDTHYIQATPLLYHVLLYADGTRTLGEIAREIERQLGIEITGDDVDWLVRNKLIPSGLLDVGLEDLGDGPRPAEIPVLGLRWRIPLLPYEWTVPFTDPLKYLYWPPLMVAVVIAAIAINIWLFVDGSVFASAEALLYRPELILLLFVLDTISTLFHEFGHAAALRRAKARYGWIGFALYIIFPVFYTDVTHIYRLNRRERIRVDLGGMYFELIMMVIFYTCYLVTGHGIFLIAIVLTTLSFLQQFTPFLRFDGYYTVADIMGINEPLSIVKPFLRDRIPWPRGRQKSLPDMRTGAKIAFSFYLAAVVAFLTYPLFIGAFAGRQFATTMYESGRFLLTQSITYWSNGDILWGMVSTLQFCLWALIPLGISLFLLTLIRHFWIGGRALVMAILARFQQDPAPKGQETT
jgi:putative peptide zinc metalloprotease protein